MAVIAPFRGLRYNLKKISRMEDVVTPPYDVIDQKKHDFFLKKNPYNMIQLDLSKTISNEKESNERYDSAKRLLDAWQEEGVLKRDVEPAIYLYQTDYMHPAGISYTRKGFVCAVQLSDFKEGIVKPHEKTFKEVTSDRLKLLETCQTQFSKIFSIYPDPHNEVMTLLESAKTGDPLFSVKDGDSNVHSVWAVTDPAVIVEVQKFFKDKSIYIADGHHRYTTALQYRDLMLKQNNALPANSPYNFVMMYLCGMNDPGLSVLPAHRLVRIPQKMTAEECMRNVGQGFEVEEITGGSREFLLGELFSRMDEEKNGRKLLGFYHPKDDRCFLLKAIEEEYRKIMDGKFHDVLLDLDVVMLSEFVLDHYFGLDHSVCEKEKRVDYYSDPDAAIDEAVKESIENENDTPALFLMNGTRVEQVKNVADEDLVMPHKSTYFYPKILTGLIMNKIVADERIS